MKICFTLWILLFLVPGICRAQTWQFEDDMACELFGCVLVHDGQNARIYLLHSADGTPAEFYAGMESENFRLREDRNGGVGSGFMPGIDTTGDGQVNIRADDRNSTGFLDAGDSLPGFPLTPATNIAFASGRIQHSFRFASNVRFALYARLNRFAPTDDMKKTVTPGDIGFYLDVPSAGIGDRALSGSVRKAPGIRTLADIRTTAVKIAESDATAVSGADIRQSAVYLITTCEFPAYNLASGHGSIDIGIDYMIYKP